MTFIYVNVSERGQPCQALLLIFVHCVNVVSSFLFMLFSCIFVIAVSKGIGFFLACEVLSSSGITSLKAFS
jgi:ABC-type bacteriocin/lantibiotic exporter with double-glycine peptidase domain